MKKNIFIVMCLSFMLVSFVIAEDAESKWITKGMLGFSFNNNYFNNYLNGGKPDESSITQWAISVNGSAERKFGKIHFIDALELAIGRQTTTATGVSTFEVESLDKIKNEALAEYEISKIVNPYFSFTVESQFTELFQPTLLSEAIGGAFVFIKSDVQNLQTRAGVAAKELVNSVLSDANYFEGGMEIVTDYDIKFKSDIQFKSNLSLFFPFNRTGGNTLDVKWDNTLLVQLSKYLTLSINAKIYYLEPQTTSIQFANLTTLGLTYKLF